MGKWSEGLKKAEEEAEEKRKKEASKLERSLQQIAWDRSERIRKEKQELLDMELRKWAVEQSIAWRAAAHNPTVSSFELAEHYYNYAKTGRKIRL